MSFAVAGVVAGLVLLGLSSIIWVMTGGPEKVEREKAKMEAAQKIAEKMTGAEKEKFCECGSGAYCTGPRGGEYCTDLGEKRYKTKR